VEVRKLFLRGKRKLKVDLGELENKVNPCPVSCVLNSRLMSL